jgi:hypothetical protein
VKNVCVRTPQIGSRKTPKTNFTHFVGTVSGSDSVTKLLGDVRATLRTTFRPRFESRVPRFFFDLRFVAKSSADYAECGDFGKAKFTICAEHRLLTRSFRLLAGKHADEIDSNCAKRPGKLPR